MGINKFSLLILGLFCLTLVEYMLHKFLFHLDEESGKQLTLTHITGKLTTTT